MKIGIVGTGPMAAEYAKVLSDLRQPFVVISRSGENARRVAEPFGADHFGEGLDAFLQKNNSDLPEFVINAVGIEALTEITQKLISGGIPNILVEKPAFAYPDELAATIALQHKYKSNVVLAYNRRFYQSVLKARELISKDGGVTSFTFEFTEWSHVIKGLTKPEAEWQNWFYGNSTHVIDTAFFLGGQPDQMCAFVGGKKQLSWHQNSSIYAGAGVSKTGALFSYHANWESPGRWFIEILTKKHRYIFRPMEKLFIQNIGSVNIEEVQGVDYRLDTDFKPGVYLQTKAFLERDQSLFCTLSEQNDKLKIYREMAGY